MVTRVVSIVTLMLGTIHCSLRFPLTMPYVTPQLPNNESYLCTGVAVQADTPLYITGFSPLASQHTVHHLMVIGCTAPVSGVETNLWNCGGSLMEPQLESPGSTCPGSQTSQVTNGSIMTMLTMLWCRCCTCGLWTETAWCSPLMCH